MSTGSVLDWANTNAPAITALATILLVLITAVYVVVTYLLVREQRSQKKLPKLHFHLVPRPTDDQAGPRADLKIKNVSEITATEVTFLRGAEDGIPVDMPSLGMRATLLPGEDQMARIRPMAVDDHFAEGDLPLILSYSDSTRTIAVFEVLLLVFERPDGGWKVENMGSMERTFTKRELKKLAMSNIHLWSRPGFLWRERDSSVRSLLLNREVRAALRSDLDGALGRLRVAGAQMKEMRQRL